MPLQSVELLSRLGGELYGLACNVKACRHCRSFAVRHHVFPVATATRIPCHPPAT